MHALIQERRNAISELCRRYGVQRLEVFGSAARGDDFDPATSDVDFLVEFAPRSERSALDEYFGFQADLARLLERRVDLLEVRAVRNPYVLSGIARARELVYAA